MTNQDLLAFVLNKIVDENTTKELTKKFKLEDELMDDLPIITNKLAPSIELLPDWKKRKRKRHRKGKKSYATRSIKAKDS